MFRCFDMQKNSFPVDMEINFDMLMDYIKVQYLFETLELRVQSVLMNLTIRQSKFALYNIF